MRAKVYRNTQPSQPLPAPTAEEGPKRRKKKDKAVDE
tara:strand:- start:706 stop:816 length:111 start_codon:yes stop_codon:yes gene_type:complete